MAVAKLDVIEQYLDNNGNLLADGLVYTYAAGGLTPLATHTDSGAGTEHDNPIQLDSSGRPPGDGIWFTKGLAYKVVIKTSAGVELESVDGVSIDDTAALIAAAISQGHDDAFYFQGGAGTSSLELYRTKYVRAWTIAANASGSQGSIGTNPTASFVMLAKVNGTTKITITVSTGGVFSFTTSSGAAVDLAAGDVLTVLAPSVTDATAANIAVRFKGTLA